MDYSTLAYVKQALHSKTVTDDALLQRFLTAASRAIDRKCTGAPDGDDYFKLETISGERLHGQIDYTGETILTYPHKPIITSCSAFAYQKNITTELFTVDPARVECDGGKVVAYPASMPTDFPARCRVTMSYTGGLAASGSAMVEDLQEVIVLLAIRFYREDESGMSDSIGVAELSTAIYTKAWPVRALEQIRPFIRRVGWRNVA